MKSTYLATMSEISRLQAMADKLRRSEMPGVIARIRQAIDAYGFTASDLGLTGGTSTPTAKVKGNPEKSLSPAIGVAKYRDPKSGKTWTGRGKPPSWIAGVKNRESFAVSSVDSASPDAKAVKKVKPAASFGVPKYRDPSTGKTWTGRGKPPTWIAVAKSRADFAIDASTGSEVGNSSQLVTAP